MSFISEQLEAKIGRRALLQWSSLAGATMFGGAMLAGCGGSSNGNGGGSSSAATDLAVLNFALNLEYLEAEYYLHAINGTGLSATEAGTGAAAVITKQGSTQVPFSNATIGQYAEEIALDEENHVKFLRSALTTNAVSRPSIDLFNSFNAAYAAATNTPGATFDPFANDLNFLLGAFLFEDVGVTAYKGAARLLTNKDYLEAAAGILAVEAYHAGALRAILTAQGAATTVQLLSDARDGSDGSADLDQGLTSSGGGSNLSPTGPNSIVYGRNTSQVLGIVYLRPNSASATTGLSAGGFFPNGMNGAIKTINVAELSATGGIS